MPGDIHRIREKETSGMLDQVEDISYDSRPPPYWYLHSFANVDIVLSSNDVTIRVIWHIRQLGRNQ